ncbi:hypothetical protein GQ42DRAFT_172682, partial [Ramicandelaber brevisporus]
AYVYVCSQSTSELACISRFSHSVRLSSFPHILYTTHYPLPTIHHPLSTIHHRSLRSLSSSRFILISTPFCLLLLPFFNLSQMADDTISSAGNSAVFDEELAAQVMRATVDYLAAIVNLSYASLALALMQFVGSIVLYTSTFKGLTHVASTSSYPLVLSIWLSLATIGWRLSFLVIHTTDPVTRSQSANQVLFYSQWLFPLLSIAGTVMLALDILFTYALSETRHKFSGWVDAKARVYAGLALFVFCVCITLPNAAMALQVSPMGFSPEPLVSRQFDVALFSDVWLGLGLALCIIVGVMIARRLTQSYRYTRGSSHGSKRNHTSAANDYSREDLHYRGLVARLSLYIVIAIAITISLLINRHNHFDAISWAQYNTLAAAATLAASQGLFNFVVFTLVTIHIVRSPRFGGKVGMGGAGMLAGTAGAQELPGNSPASARYDDRRSTTSSRPVSILSKATSEHQNSHQLVAALRFGNGLRHSDPKNAGEQHNMGISSPQIGEPIHNVDDIPVALPPCFAPNSRAPISATVKSESTRDPFADGSVGGNNCGFDDDVLAGGAIVLRPVSMFNPSIFLPSFPTPQTSPTHSQHEGNSADGTQANGDKNSKNVQDSSPSEDTHLSQKQQHSPPQSKKSKNFITQRRTFQLSQASLPSISIASNSASSSAAASIMASSPPRNVEIDVPLSPALFHHPLQLDSLDRFSSITITSPPLKPPVMPLTVANRSSGEPAKF